MTATASTSAADPPSPPPAVGTTATAAAFRVCDLLGFPLAAVTLKQVVAMVRASALSRQRLFFSTINVNYVVAAHADPAFHAWVLRSNLLVADGAPLVALSRATAVALPERVAGSDLINELRRCAGAPLKVYFFGGLPGTAERASANLNAENGGLQCVGWQSPGFGDVASMSRPEQIEQINQARPDLLVVSLGVKKGHAWIDRNMASLEVPAISYLGAVVNFVAGEVSRSPAWASRLGLEWLWRILQEPSLWRRYWQDGKSFLPMAAREYWRHRRLRA